MENEILVGVDIGGTSIEAGCVVNKTIVSKSKKDTNANRKAEDILETLFEVIRNVLLPDTQAICVGVPGLLDLDNGVVLNISNIPSWKNMPLKSRLEEYFNKPVYLNNDANCFALGEKHFGNAQKYKSIAAISLGTGVGSGLIINNKLHAGLYGGAGEIGCWPYLNQNFEAYCGSGFFIEKHNITGLELYRKALAGDQEAQDLFRIYGTHLGKLIKNLLYVLAPEAIVLGGAISKAFDFFEIGINQELEDFPFELIGEKLVIEQSQLISGAILGATGLYYNANN